MSNSVNNTSELPLVSVVMCTYNGMPYVKEAVSNIVKQTYTNWELIISDDNSTDGTRAFLKSLENDKRITVILQPRNLGYVNNKTFVHQQARGLYITQLDQDDLCAPDRLERQIHAADQHPEMKIIASGYQRIAEDGEILETVSPQEHSVHRVARYEDFKFWFPSLLIHREVFETLGYFDPYFSGAIGDDIYWTMRAVRLYPIYCLREPLYAYRTNPKSITNTFTNPRKLIVPALLTELFRQQEESGSDWLQQKNFEELKKFETRLLNDRVFMGQQYRIGAAKAVDNRNFSLAQMLLIKSLQLNPFNFSLLRTFLYLVKQKLKG